MKEQISNALVAAALAGEFVGVSYDTEARVLLLGANVVPESIETNEVRATFEIDSRHGRAYKNDRVNWIWELRLRFGGHAILDRFEEAITLAPITIPHDIPGGVTRTAFLHLQTADYDHPPRGNPSNGTKVVYRFSANLCPL